MEQMLINSNLIHSSKFIHSNRMSSMLALCWLTSGIDVVLTRCGCMLIGCNQRAHRFAPFLCSTACFQWWSTCERKRTVRHA